MFKNFFSVLRSSLRRKCPHCKKGAICKSHFQVHTECPECNQIFKPPEEGWAGPSTINYILTIIACLFFLLFQFLVSFGLRGTALTVGTGIFAIFFSGLIYPYVYSFWIVLLYNRNFLKKSEPKDENH